MAKPIDWRNSEARKILLNDLERDVLSLDGQDVTAEVAWEKTYKKMNAFANVPFKQFKARLADHRAQAKNVDWRKSKARRIILIDLERGNLKMDEEDQSTAEAWNTLYKGLAEFENVPFEQFKTKLADHRAQAKDSYFTSLRDEQALMHDRAIYPRSKVNHRGEKVFDMSPAKQLLKQDVKAGLHKIKNYHELRAFRPAYQEFPHRVFSGHVRQEIKFQKYAHFLEQKKLAF